MFQSRHVKDRVMSPLGSSLRCSGLMLLGAAILISMTGCPPDTTPPGNVTGLTATAGDGQIELAWTNPADFDFAGVKIQRKTGGYPTSPTDGTTVYSGTGEAFISKPVDNATPYYFGAYAYDLVLNYASGAQATATPTSALARADVLEEYAGIRADIKEPIPAENQADLLAKLDASEALYREGDTCGAGGSIATELLPAVQAAREAARRAACTNNGCVYSLEALYNRAHTLRFTMLGGELLKAECAGAERVGLVADTTVNTEDVTQVLTVAAFGEPKLLIMEHEGIFYTQVQVPGADVFSGEPGAPAVPIFRRLIAAPPGAEVSFDFEPVVAETIGMNLIPAQESAVDKTDPSTFDDPPFTKNTDIYASDAPFPANPCTLTPLGEVRGLPMFFLEAAAGQYNPVTQELRLFKSVNVNVHFKGGEGFLEEDAVDGFNNASLYTAENVINSMSVMATLYKGPARRISGAEFLILVPHEFRDAADTLAIWKRTKGITTMVIEVGGTTAYPTPDSIRALIKSHYDHDLIRPSYILLLADSDLIPTYEMAAPIPVGASTIGSDWPYAVMGVPETSTVPDFAVGRIPSKTLFEAAVVVDKIVKYEQTPPVSATFYNRAAIASQFQCCRSGVSAGTDERAFVETSEFARNVLVAQGKSVDRIYTETVDIAGDPTPRRYYDGTLLPAAIGPGAFAWSGTTADISAAYNAGRFLFIHRDHGGPDEWVNPFFGLSEIDALANGALQPVVFSVNCASGLFDNEQVPGVMGTSASEFYVAERMLRKGNAGAIGVLGDSRNSPTWANNALLRGYIDAIWPNAIPSFGPATSKHRLGDILNHGKAYMLTQIGIGPAGAMPSSDDATAELRLWHCIGDPTLEIWTGDPHAFFLPSVVIAVKLAGILNVTYETNGALITAFQTNPNGGMVTLGRGTVADGQAQIKLLNDPLAGVPVQLSVSLENAIPIQLSTDLSVAG